MNKCTHAKCLNDVLLEETDVILFKQNKVYKAEWDYKSLLYYIEPEDQEEDFLPDQIAVSAVNPNFHFFRQKD